MYCKFYNLKEKPFNVTSDPAFFFASRAHQEAISHLSYGVNQRKGILVITGEIGTGKTTLCRFFLDTQGENIKTAFILNPYFPQEQLLVAIVKDFGISVKDESSFSCVWHLNRFLLSQSEKGNNIVLIIDEAQNLTVPQLEQVRLLSNLETHKHKLLQIVLVGQPELNRKLELYELRQLQQRIAVRYHIQALGEDEINQYIRHRLNIVGGNHITFTPSAVKAITELSIGTPRLVNIICDRALLAGFVKETYSIDEEIIQRCRQDLAGLIQREELKK